MLYSIIVPVYNRPGEVKELLDSLMAQTVKPFELLIIEDGSKERCDHLLGHYRSFFTIHYFYKENSGRSETRNYGMQRANGDYICDEPFALNFSYTKDGVEISGVPSEKTDKYYLYNNTNKYYRCYVHKNGQTGYTFPTLYKLQ